MHQELNIRDNTETEEKTLNPNKHRLNVSKIRARQLNSSVQNQEISRNMEVSCERYSKYGIKTMIESDNA